MLYTPTKGRMKTPVKNAKRRFLQKQIMAFSYKIVLEKAPSQTSEWVRNMPLQRRDHNAWEKPMANSFTISKLAAINLGRKRTSSSLWKILCTLQYILKSDQNTKPYSAKETKIKENLKYIFVILYMYVSVYIHIYTHICI